MAKNFIISICLLILPLIAYPDTLSPLAFAQNQVGVRETTQNCGPEVELFLNAVGLPCGFAWCSAFVSACFLQAGYPHPNTAWSPTVVAKGALIKKGPVFYSPIKPQQVFGLFFSSLGRIAHTGIIEKIDGNTVFTIEGNTNVAGSREGDGVYRKIRRLSQLHTIVDYG